MTSLIVAKGARSRLDPTYACISHDTYRGQYALLEVDNGSVTRRTVTNNRAAVENTMRTFKGTVFVDNRSDRSLLPLTAPTHATPMDLKTFRRAKSEEEADALQKLSKATHAHLYGDKVPDEGTFRGAASATESYDRSAFTVTKAKGFTQYRGGFQAESGLCSDLTRVEPHTLEWERRLDRVYEGLDAVRGAIAPGVRVATLDKIFRCHLNETDVVYGRCVFDTGYEANEGVHDVVEPYDHKTIGVAVGDGVETALVYRGSIFVNAPTAAPESNVRPATDYAATDAVCKFHPATPRCDTLESSLAYFKSLTE